MATKSIIAAAVALSGLINTASAGIFTSPDKQDQYNNQHYFDMTSVCEHSGDCQEAYVTVIESGACKAFDAAAHQQLLDTIGQQSQKTDSGKLQVWETGPQDSPCILAPFTIALF